MHDQSEKLGPRLLSSSGETTRAIILTVAIPAYRHERFIADCLHPLMRVKALDRLEILILDDFSPDDTVDCAMSVLQQGAANYRIYRNSRNRGLTFGLDFLLSTAAGQYVIFCGSDDALIPSAIDEMISHPPSSVCTIYNAEYCGDLSGPVYGPGHFISTVATAKDLYTHLSKEFPRPLLLQSTAFNVTFLRTVTPWRDGLWLDDWPTFIRVARVADKTGDIISFRPDICLTKYRIHGGGLHNRTESLLEGCLEVIEKEIDCKYRKTALSNTLSDIAIIYLYQGDLRKALCLYINSIFANPISFGFYRLPKRLVLAALRRFPLAILSA